MAFWHDISLGRYIYRESLIHHLDPRVKLISLLFLGTGIIFLKDPLSILFLGIFLIFTVALSRIPYKTWYKGFRLFIWFFLIIISFYAFSGYSSSESSINLLLSLLNGILIIIRWAIMIGFCFILTMTTTPPEIAYALEKLLSPLKKIKIPIHDLCIMCSLTIHFLPLLKEEIDRIIKARMIQGIDFSAGSITERVHNLAGLVTPLIHRLYRRSENMALAMEARGYSCHGTKGNRNSYLFKPISRKDTLILILILIFLITLWCINRLIFIRTL